MKWVTCHNCFGDGCAKCRHTGQITERQYKTDCAAIEQRIREFQLRNHAPKPTWKPDPIPGNRGKQLAMFGGLDCPEGTRDLFDVDGCDRLPALETLGVGEKLVMSAEDFAALFDEPTERLAWCSHCQTFTEQTADLLPFVCNECGQEP